MSRITDLAANSQITSYMLEIQKRLKDTEVQVSSEKISQNYQGIADDSQRLVSLENSVLMLDRFTRTNNTTDLRLSTAGSALEGIADTVHDFEEVLQTFKQNGSFDEAEVADLQEWAFRSLKAMQGYLNTEADGRYVFSGSRVTTKPADLELTTLDAFQTRYNGDSVTFPTTRDAHLLDAVTLTPATTGNLTFIAGTLAPPVSSTITAATAGGFAGLEAGATITIAGTAANDGTYTIAAIDGTNSTITLNPSVIVTGTAPVPPAIPVPEAYTSITTPGNYYSGDRQSYTHRVDETQTFDFDVNAIDPAFEKAIRAMSIIAQGDFGTPGGLDQNQSRVDDALYLLDSAQESTVGGTPPYGAEEVSNLSSLQSNIAFDRVLIKSVNANKAEITAFFEERIAELENVDTLDAITRLLDDARALEASYQAMAKIRSMSLVNYL